MNKEQGIMNVEVKSQILNPCSLFTFSYVQEMLLF